MILAISQKSKVRRMNLFVSISAALAGLLFGLDIGVISGAVERRMSHQERNRDRAAYIHKAEHLEERKIMLQWWADYLEACKVRTLTPYMYFKDKN